MEDLIQRILGMPTLIKKSIVNSYVDSLFIDNKAMVEIPRKFSFLNIKLYNGTSDIDNNNA